MKESRSVEGGGAGNVAPSPSCSWLWYFPWQQHLVIGSELAHWVIFLRTFESQIWLSNKLCL